MKDPLDDIDFSALTDPAPQITDAQLTTISELAADVIKVEDRIEQGRALLKQLEERHLKLIDTDLPAAMTAAGVSSFALADGSAIEVAPFVQASLAGPKKLVAIQWLKDTDQDGMIKTTVTSDFGKGEAAKAKAAVAALAAAGFKASLSEDVNTGSFKALVKECLREGKSVPLAEVGVYVATRATVTRKK